MPPVVGLRVENPQSSATWPRCTRLNWIWSVVSVKLRTKMSKLFKNTFGVKDVTKSDSKLHNCKPGISKKLCLIIHDIPKQARIKSVLNHNYGIIWKWIYYFYFCNIALKQKRLIQKINSLISLYSRQDKNSWVHLKYSKWQPLFLMSPSENPVLENKSLSNHEKTAKC